MTTHDLARETGNANSTITKWARELGIPRRGWHGRYYDLTVAEARLIRERMRRKPGRPARRGA
jgi:hypothetical protein